MVSFTDSGKYQTSLKPLMCNISLTCFAQLVRCSLGFTGYIDTLAKYLKYSYHSLCETTLGNTLQCVHGVQYKVGIFLLLSTVHMNSLSF